jgi:hypothetical protein
MGEPERGEAAPRIRVSFWCAKRHETRLGFAVDAAIPETWDCPRCGNPAGQNEQDPPAPPRAEPYKTHLAYLKERRSASDGEVILAEALTRLHGGASAAAPAPPPAASQDGRTAGRSSPRGRRRGPARRSPAGATGDRPQPGRRGRGDPRAAGRAPGPGQAGGPDQLAGDAPAAAAGQSATRSPGTAEPASPSGTEAQWCGTCGYRTDAVGHKMACLGQ